MGWKEVNEMAAPNWGWCTAGLVWAELAVLCCKLPGDCMMRFGWGAGNAIWGLPGCWRRLGCGLRVRCARLKVQGLETGNVSIVT